ncbi:MAG: aminoacyl-tRNA hydrolase [Mariprofundales bacterium]|nr:aminoacyl-tRNA hydrolase [Mariprofundales bacterium]
MTRKLLVGLGNPGPQYQGSRHNVGFRFIDRLAADQRVTLTEERAFKVAITEWRPTTELEILLVKPLCFMNNSGESVGKIARYYKIGVDDITVVHDDLDMIAGKLRIKKGGGTGGHNGIKSLNLHIGNGYTRVKVGIGRPTNRADTTNWVLSPLTTSAAHDETILFDCLLPQITAIVTGQLATATNSIQLKLRETLLGGSN